MLLSIPTLLLIVSKPLANQPQIVRTAAKAYFCFILVIAVIFSLWWDNYGNQLGLWVFNDAKCTEFNVGPNHLPLEEVFWLFHHVILAALCQMKMFDLFGPNTATKTPVSGPTKAVVTLGLAGLSSYGLW